MKNRWDYIKRLTVIFVLLDAVLLGAGGWLYANQDMQAPVLYFDENMTEVYDEDMEAAELLKGVTAVDETDGDVTETVIIEKIVEALDGTVIVTYAARDEANNIVKGSRSFRRQ